MSCERVQPRAFERQTERPCPPAQALQIPFSLSPVPTPSPTSHPSHGQPANTTLHTSHEREPHTLAGRGVHLRRCRYCLASHTYEEGIPPSRTKIDRPNSWAPGRAPEIRTGCCHRDRHSPRKPRMAPHHRLGDRLPFPIHARPQLLRSHLCQAASPTTTVFATTPVAAAAHAAGSTDTEKRRT